MVLSPNRLREYADWRSIFAVEGWVVGGDDGALYRRGGGGNAAKVGATRKMSQSTRQGG